MCIVCIPLLCGGVGAISEHVHLLAQAEQRKYFLVVECIFVPPADQHGCMVNLLQSEGNGIVHLLDAWVLQGLLNDEFSLQSGG